MVVRKTFLSLWCFSLFLAFVCFSPKLYAQEAEVKLQSIRGPFNPFITPETWGINKAVIINSSNEPRQLKISGTTVDKDAGKLEFSRDFTVPPASTRQIDFAFRFSNIETSANSTNVSKKASYKQTYILADAKTSQQLGLATSLLIPVGPRTLKVSVIHCNPDQRDSAGYLKDNEHTLAAKVQFISANIKTLPNRWFAYSMLDMIFIGNYKQGMLDQAQLKALKQWVANGGTLLLMGGVDVKDMLNSELGRWAGVTGLGSYMTDSFSINGSNIKIESPTWFGEIYPIDADVLIRNGSWPLLTVKQLGQGRIMVLACELIAAKPINDKFNVWESVRQQTNKIPLLDTSLFSASITHRERIEVKNPNAGKIKSSAGKNHKKHRVPKTKTKVKEITIVPGYQTLQEIAGRKTTDRIVPAGAMFAIGGLTILFGALLRFKRRGEYLWVILIPLVIFVGIGAYLYGGSLGNPQRLTNVGMITGLGDSTARVQQFYAYYSGPKSRLLTFKSGSEDSTLMPAGKSSLAGIKRTQIVTADTQLEMPNRNIRPNKTTAFFTETIEKFDPLNANLSFGSDGLAGVINNKLNQTISDAVLFVNGMSMRVGTLKPGRNVVKLGNIDLLGKGEFTSSVVQQDTKWNDLIKNMLTQGGFGKDIELAKPVLIGQLPGSTSKLIETDGINIQGRSIMVWPLKYQPSKKGDEISIPKAFVNMDFKNPGSPIWNVQTREFNSSHRPGKLLIVAKQPESAGNMKNISAVVDLSLQGQEYDLKVYWAKIDPNDPRGRKAKRGKLIKTIYRPSGKYRLELNDIDSKLDNGKIVLLLRADKTKQNIIQEKAKSLNVLGGSNVATWKIVDISVSMKGTVK